MAEYSVRYSGKGNSNALRSACGRQNQEAESFDRIKEKISYVYNSRTWKSGKEYAGSRHNVGFMTLDELADSIISMLGKKRIRH